MNKGQSIIELLVAIALLAVFLPGLLTGLVASRNGRPQQQQRLSATELLQEAEEAVRSVRETGWTAFATDGTFHPVISGSSWTLVSGSQTVNGFTRQIVISDVARNSQGTIVASGGTIDPSTKQVAITVSWAQPFSSSVTTTMYMARYLNNSVNTQTTQTDFNAGTKSSTVVVATAGSSIPNDGQVQLGAGGAGGDWCQPQNSVLATFNLPGQGVVEAISATSSATRYAYAYTTTGGNASGDAVDKLTIDNSPNTPSITNPASNTEAKAYGVFVDNNNNYVYFNENNPPNHTVRIARASDLSDIGYFDVSHTTGQSIFVSGNTGYTTGQTNKTMYSFDVSTIKGSSSQTQLGSVSLAGNGNRVFVVGTNAYVATDSTTSQLQIINVANPSNMTVAKSINLGNGQGAVDVFVNSSQTYAYVATSYVAGGNDFFVIDLTNTNNIYGYTTNGMSPKALAVVTGNRAILVGQGGTLYQVFNTGTPSSVTYCGGMSPVGATSINAVVPIYQGGLAYSYILTDNANAEFQIILGGSGGQFTTSGTFESSTFDPGYQAAFNRMSATILQPSSTTIQLQVGIANQVSGSCPASYTYLGPDGTSNTYFTASGSTITGTIPFVSGIGNYANPGRCFRYKAFLSTQDNTQTPILYDVSVNYSP